MKKLAKYSLTGLAIGGLVLLPGLQTYAATTQSANTVINGNIGKTITITATPTLNINLDPTGASVTSTDSTTVTVNTNSTSGYNLTLSTSSAVTTLAKGSDVLNATGGTYASPTVLALNSWGYRIDGSGGFAAGPTTVLNSAASSTLTFAGVPALGSAQQIKSTSSTASNDVTTVWYGIRADSSKPSGTYTNTVVYTATVK